MKSPRRYPLNVVTNESVTNGWLFHGKSRAPERIAKLVQVIMAESGLTAERGSFYLFPLNVPGLDKKLILKDKPTNITQPGLTGEAFDDIEHFPDLVINNIDTISR